jgi:hypothetical protein
MAGARQAGAPAGHDRGHPHQAQCQQGDRNCEDAIAECLHPRAIRGRASRHLRSAVGVTQRAWPPRCTA